LLYFLVVFGCFCVLIGWAARLLCTVAGMGGHLILGYQKSVSAHPDCCANLCWCEGRKKTGHLMADSNHCFGIWMRRKSAVFSEVGGYGGRTISGTPV